MKFRRVVCILVAFLIVIITALGLRANDFVIQQNGYMPTARDGVQLSDKRITYSGDILKSIDGSTKFAWLGDIFYNSECYYSIGDLFALNRFYLLASASMLLLVGLYGEINLRRKQ